MPPSAIVALPASPRRSRPAIAGEPYRLDRRREGRRGSRGSFAATYAGDGRLGVTRLELVDRSAPGLGVLSRVRIEPGMAVTICREGSSIPWLRGLATRCIRNGEVYRVGIAFSPRHAA